MLFARQRVNPLDAVEPVATIEDLGHMQAEVREIEVKEPVAEYLLRVVARTRDHRDVELGASPRGALALFRAAQARALLGGRAYVSPDDVQALAGPVLGHRLVLTPEARYGGRGAEGVLREVVQGLRVPV